MCWLLVTSIKSKFFSTFVVSHGDIVYVLLLTIVDCLREADVVCLNREELTTISGRTIALTEADQFSKITVIQSDESARSPWENAFALRRMFLAGRKRQEKVNFFTQQFSIRSD